jgi:hypothetical protein
MEPMFPALLVSAVCFTADLMVRRVKRSGGEMR